MSLLKYKHEKIETKEKVKNSKIVFNKTNNFEVDISFDDSLKDSFDELNLAKTLLSSSFENSFIKLNSVFDSELINDLNLLKSFFEDSGEKFDFLTSLGNDDLYFDLKLELLPFLFDELRNNYLFENSLSEALFSIKEKNIIEEGYILRDNGIIKKDGNVVFDPNDAAKIIIKSVDFEELIVIAEPGINIPFYFFEDSGGSSFKGHDFFFDSSLPLEYKILESSVYRNLVLENNNISDKKIKKINFNNSKITLEDFSFFINPINVSENIKRMVLDSEQFDKNELASYEECKTKEINFLKLLLLLLLGGGYENLAPLNKISGTINSSESVCDIDSFDNSHKMMWSKNKKQGLKISILQILNSYFKLYYGFNIKRLVVRPCIKIKIFKKRIQKCWTIQIFPGICLFGGIEKVLLKYQNKISAEINEMFSCTKVYLKPNYINGELKTIKSDKPDKNIVKNDNDDLFEKVGL